MLALRPFPGVSVYRVGVLGAGCAGAWPVVVVGEVAARSSRPEFA